VVEIDLSFNKLSYLRTVIFSIISIANKLCQCRSIAYWVDNTIGTKFRMFCILGK
jgi:hypothetical protein